MIIHAFVSSWLDYCDSRCSCLSKSSLHHLQSSEHCCKVVDLVHPNNSHHSHFILSTLPVQFSLHFKVLCIQPCTVRLQSTSLTCSIPTSPVGHSGPLTRADWSSLEPVWGQTVKRWPCFWGGGSNTVERSSCKCLFCSLCCHFWKALKDIFI